MRPHALEHAQTSTKSRVGCCVAHHSTLMGTPCHTVHRWSRWHQQVSGCAPSTRNSSLRHASILGGETHRDGDTANIRVLRAPCVRTAAQRAALASLRCSWGRGRICSAVDVRVRASRRCDGLSDRTTACGHRSSAVARSLSPASRGCVSPNRRPAQAVRVQCGLMSGSACSR
jgi:hypothetical protein